MYLLAVIALAFLPALFNVVNYAFSFARAPKEQEERARRRWNFLKRSSTFFFLLIIVGLVSIMLVLPESISSISRILLSVLFIFVTFLLHAMILGILDKKIRGVYFPMMGYIKFQTFFFVSRFLAVFIVLAFLYYPFFERQHFAEQGLGYSGSLLFTQVFAQVFDIVLFITAIILFVLAILFQMRVVGRITGVLSPMSKDEHGAISDSILKLAEKAGVVKEKVSLYTINTFGYPFFNAFAAPFKALYFTKPLLEELDTDEILAISAHEIGHLLTIKRRTIYVLLLYAGLVSFVWLLSPIVSVFISGSIFLSAWIIFIGLIFFVFIIFFRRISQKFEVAADETSASLMNDPTHLITALEKVYELNMVPRRFDKRGSERESHPSLERRVAELKGETLAKPKRSILRWLFRFLIRLIAFVVIVIVLTYFFLYLRW